MLPVFICEDNRMQRERLTKYIEDYIMVEHFDMKLELSTGDPFELVSRMPTHQGMGLYFLDIDLGQPDMNGIGLSVVKKKRLLRCRWEYFCMMNITKSNGLTRLCRNTLIRQS